MLTNGPMPLNAPDFVEWREQSISQERGSRVVHYYLEDLSGKSHLAVVGTERSLRHMFYSISPEFCQEYGADLGLKWRSRREVIDWLSSLLSRPIDRQEHSINPDLSLTVPSVDEAACGLGNEMEKDGFGNPGNHLRKISSLKGKYSDIVWSGASWTCGKQLKHYGAFCRNGTTISARSFVLVMSEEETRYLAYLEDMYEDRKGHKKVKVRWFHQNQEFGCAIPPPSPHPREVFITPYLQAISAECVDDHATVLTPDHYNQLLDTLPDITSAAIHICFRQYIKNRFKTFDISSLSGYYGQTVLLSLNICSLSVGDGDSYSRGSTIKSCGPKRIPIVKGRQILSHLDSHLIGEIQEREQTFQHTTVCGLHERKPSVLYPLFKVGEKVEVLCQDSGIRGCWFRCTVLQVSQKQLKVRYDDVQNEDESGKLEEWVRAFKAAAPDKLGMRCSGRLTIRPLPPHCDLLDDVALSVGSPIDAWWNDGWWEGVVVSLDNCGDDDTHAFFPGEDVFLICQRKNLRISRDWVGNQWVNIDSKPGILSSISSYFSGTMQQSVFPMMVKGAESGASVMSNHETAAGRGDDDENKVTEILEPTLKEINREKKQCVYEDAEQDVK